MTERIRVAELEPGTARVKPSQMQPVTGWDVEAFRQAGDDDSAAIRRGMLAVSSLGGGVLLLTRPVYYLTVAVSMDGIVNVTVRGQGVGKTRIVVKAGAGTLNNAFEAIKTNGSGGSPFSNLRFEGIDFTSPLVASSVTSGGVQVRARDARTWSSADRYGQAFRVQGPRDGTSVFQPAHTGLAITDCRFYGLSGLPVNINGMYGTFEFSRNYIERCKDPGVLFTEEAVARDNESRWSADNGLSWSRGCGKVTLTGNRIFNAWFSGIMVGQFDGDAGPDVIEVHGNYIENCGLNGIMADGGGTMHISGNTVRGATRGAENNTNTAGIGIRVGGIQSHPVLSALVQGNVLIDCQRGGVGIGNYTALVKTSQNLIVRPGMALFTEGGVVSDGGSYNFGVAVMGSTDVTTVGRFESSGDTVFEERTQTSGASTFPVARYDVFANTVASTDVQGVAATGVRYPTDPAFTKRLNVPGLNVGMSTTAADARVNLDASSSTWLRGWFIRAAGLLRFTMQTNGASALDFNAYNDDGTLNATTARMSRGTTPGWTFYQQLLANAGAKILGATQLGDYDATGTVVYVDGTASSTKQQVFRGATGTGTALGILSRIRQVGTTVFELVVAAGVGGAEKTAMTVVNASGQVRLLAYPPRIYADTTANRPTASTAGAGAVMFDTTLGKQITSNGTAWVDATGTSV